VAVGFFAVLVSAPLWLIVAAALSPLLPGRWRPLRFLWFLVLSMALELVSLALLFVLWVGTGFGWTMQGTWSLRQHYYHGTPKLAMARHAGPGDSFLVVHALQSIGELATGLDLDDCLVIFPEGGNFTPARRRRAITRLREAGRPEAASAAEHMASVRDLWRYLQMDTEIKIRWWRVPTRAAQ
jgi:hypothetical protein